MRTRDKDLSLVNIYKMYSVAVTLKYEGRERYSKRKRNSQCKV